MTLTAVKTRAELQEENEKLKELLRWIGPRIIRRNGNGVPSDSFCLLCIVGQPEFRRQPCRHTEIWNVDDGAGKTVK